MCTGLEFMLISGAMTAGSTAVTMGAQADAAEAAGMAGAYNAAAAQFNADQAMEEATMQAEIVKQQAAALRSSQVAQQASSGVVIGTGSAAQVIADTERLAAQDALVIMYSGISGRVAGYEQGRIAAMVGANEAAALKDAQFSTLLQGAGSIAGSAMSYNQMKGK